MKSLIRCVRLLYITVVFSFVYVTGTYDGDSGLRFGGQFLGTCDGDGMYYNDDNSYVMCSHSIAYIMPCAPGTRNSGNQLQQIQTDEDVNFTAFCDVNLVDIGYAAFHSQANGNSQGGYGNSGRSSHGSSNSGYGKGASSGYGTASKGYSRPKTHSYAKPTVKVITYQPVSYKTKKQSYVPGYSQQQKGYSSTGYGSMKPKANPGYGQVLGYGRSKASTGYGSGNTKRTGYQTQYKGYQTQTARKY